MCGGGKGVALFSGCTLHRIHLNSAPSTSPPHSPAALQLVWPDLWRWRVWHVSYSGSDAADGRPGQSCPPPPSPSFSPCLPTCLPACLPTPRRFLMAVPVNGVLMWSVPPGLRPFALAAAEFSQHLFGDIPSPPLLGWLQVGVCGGVWG